MTVVSDCPPAAGPILARARLLERDAQQAGPAVRRPALDVVAAARDLAPCVANLTDADAAEALEAIRRAGELVGRHGRLPADFSPHRPVTEDGQTPLRIVTSNLEAIAAYLRTMAFAAAVQEAQALVAVAARVMQDFAVGFEPTPPPAGPVATRPRRPAPLPGWVLAVVVVVAYLVAAALVSLGGVL